MSFFGWKFFKQIFFSICLPTSHSMHCWADGWAGLITAMLLTRVAWPGPGGGQGWVGVCLQVLLPRLAVAAAAVTTGGGTHICRDQPGQISVWLQPAPPQHQPTSSPALQSRPQQAGLSACPAAAPLTLLCRGGRTGCQPINKSSAEKYNKVAERPVCSWLCLISGVRL